MWEVAKLGRGSIFNMSVHRLMSCNYVAAAPNRRQGKEQRQSPAHSHVISVTETRLVSDRTIEAAKQRESMTRQ